MFKDVTFYMLSAHRADKLITFKQLPPEFRSRIIMVVSEDEKEAYEPVIKKYGVSVQWMPAGTLFAEKVQWIFDNCPTKYACRLEDDLSFFVRDSDKKLHTASPEETIAIFEDCVQQLYAGYPLVGVSNRGGNVFVDDDFRIATRMHHMWFVDTTVWKVLHINVCPFKEYVMDDFHAFLVLFENGYPNYVFFKYAVDDRGSNASGGVSLYRTPEVQHKSALWLAEQHPNTVKIVEKVTTSGWEGMRKNANGQNVRTDVNIAWKKAYNAGVNNNKRKQGFAFFANRRKNGVLE